MKTSSCRINNGLPSSMSDGMALLAEAGESLKTPALVGLARDLREFVVSRFPEGLPPSPAEGQGLLAEAWDRDRHPGLESLSRTEREFVSEKITAGYDRTAPAERNLVAAKEIAELQDRLSAFGNSPQDRELRTRISALGGNPEPGLDSLDRFAIKSLLVFASLGLALPLVMSHGEKGPAPF